MRTRVEPGSLRSSSALASVAALSCPYKAGQAQDTLVLTCQSALNEKYAVVQALAKVVIDLAGQVLPSASSRRCLRNLSVGEEEDVLEIDCPKTACPVIVAGVPG